MQHIGSCFVAQLFPSPITVSVVQVEPTSPRLAAAALDMPVVEGIFETAYAYRNAFPRVGPVFTGNV